MRSEIRDIDVIAELMEVHALRSKDRFPGKHLSTVVARLAVDVGRYDKDLFPDPVMYHQGFVFEDMMSRAYAEGWGLRQVYADLDGLEMSLDGFKDGRVQEMKCSKLSAKHPINDFRFWPWHVRTMGYCKAMGVLEADLTILHLNGSYELAGGRFGAQVIVPHRLWWTQQEVDKNWDMCLRKRDQLDREGGWDER